MRNAAGPGASVDAAFAAWWTATEPKLAERMFKDVVPQPGEPMANARTWLGRSVFDAYISGVHMKADGALELPAEQGAVPKAFEGTTNIAKQVSQPRVLLWKDANAWNGYMKQFGAGHTLLEGVMMTLDKSARQAALMEKLGTNPTGNLNQIIRRIQETYRSDLDGVQKFQRSIKGLENVMAQLDGTANIPQNELFAKFWSSYRTFITHRPAAGQGYAG
jgi:hypothetical protein